MRFRQKRRNKAIVWLALCGVVMGTVAALGGQETSADQFSRAVAAGQQRNFPKAEKEWRKLLATDPRSAEAYHNLGIVYYLEHKYAEAEESLKKALDLNGSLSNARVLLGASLSRQGKHRLAVIELQPALKTRLNDSAEKTARMALHESLFAQKDYSGALEALKPLAERYPNDVDLMYYLGQTYLELAQFSFRSINAIDPQCYRVHQIMGEALAKQGRYSDAIREYRLALEQKSDLNGLHFQIGLSLLNNERTAGREDEAIREFEAELKVNPHAPSKYRLAKVYQRRGDLDRASVYLMQAIQLDSSYVAARVALAQILIQQGILPDAEKQLDLAARLEPTNPVVHYRLARLYQTQNRRDAAAEEFQKFKQMSSRRQSDDLMLGLAAQPGSDLDDDYRP
jgi:tetratricopeptide (TPR) repeat protein